MVQYWGGRFRSCRDRLRSSAVFCDGECIVMIRVSSQEILSLILMRILRMEGEGEEEDVVARKKK